LDLIKVNIYRTALARCRLGMSPFSAHRLRYSLSEANRVCPFCSGKVGNEAHVLFDCIVHGNIRNMYINKVDNSSGKTTGLKWGSDERITYYFELPFNLRTYNDVQDAINKGATRFSKYNNNISLVWDKMTSILSDSEISFKNKREAVSALFAYYHSLVGDDEVEETEGVDVHWEELI